MGGIKLGYPDNHRMEFIMTTPISNLPFVGFQIYFSIDEASKAYASFSTTDGHPATIRQVMIKLHHGSWVSDARMLSEDDISRLPPCTGDRPDKLAFFRFVMKEGKRAAVQNFGIPVRCGPVDQEILDGDAPIDGVTPLLDLCRQTEFVVLVKASPELVAAAKRQFSNFFPAKPQPVFGYATG